EQRRPRRPAAARRTGGRAPGGADLRARRCRHLPAADRRRPRGRLDVRQVPRRDHGQRGRRRRPARPAGRHHHRRRRRPVRSVRAARAARPRGHRRARGDQPDLRDAGHLLRDLPAGRLPAVLLPQAHRTRPAGAARRHRPGRRPGHRADVALGERAERGAEPGVALRGPRGARPAALHRARPRLPADVLGHPGPRQRAGPEGAAPGHGRRRQPRGVRGRRRRDRPRAGRRRAAGRRRRARGGQAGSEGGAGQDPLRGAGGEPTDPDHPAQRPGRRGLLRRLAVPRAPRGLAAGAGPRPRQRRRRDRRLPAGVLHRHAHRGRDRDPAGGGRPERRAGRRARRARRGGPV
ncbi:MAG: 5-keto-2-deoxygluconokinase, partial [uncultured Friedmanniella sp.]